jgi:polyisoprenoid-binding protein YceI
VRGTFRLRAGDIRVADPVEDSAAHATIDAASFHTGTAARDKAIRSASYLDTERHPDIVFASTRVSDQELHGTLTVRGVTRPLTLTVHELSHVDGELRLTAQARVDRYEFGITAGRGMTGRRLTLTLHVAAAR